MIRSFDILAFRRVGLIPQAISSQDMAERVNRNAGRNREVVPEKPRGEITLTRRWLGAIGVDMACLFPTPMLLLATRPQVEVAMARPYNSWLSERILQEDKCIVSMIYLLMNEPHEAEKMIDEFVVRKGVFGFLSTGYLKRPVNDSVNMRIYAKMEEHGMPTGLHAAYHLADTSLAQLNKFISLHALGFSFCNIIHMTNWHFSGIPERFPELNTIWTKAAWLGFRSCVGSYATEEGAKRLHAGDVLFLAADRTNEQQGGAGGHVQNDERGIAAALFLGLSALGPGLPQHHL